MARQQRQGAWPEQVEQLVLPLAESGKLDLQALLRELGLDVLATRLDAEYGLQTRYEQSRFTVCRWITSEEPGKLKSFIDSHGSSIADDLDGAPVFLSTSAFQLNYDAERHPEIRFSDVKDYQRKQD